MLGMCALDDVLLGTQGVKGERRAEHRRQGEEVVVYATQAKKGERRKSRGRSRKRRGMWYLLGMCALAHALLAMQGGLG